MRIRQLAGSRYLLSLCLASVVACETRPRPALPRESASALPPVAVPAVQLVQGEGPGSTAPPGVLGARFGSAPDSAAAVAVAARLLNNSADPGGRSTFRVNAFLARRSGFLVELAPHPVGVGGGGLFWITRDGRVTILERSR
jgi:hypothetical protein